MKKTLFIIAGVIFMALASLGQSEKGVPHAKYVDRTARSFQVPMKVGEIVYLSDSSKYYMLTQAYTANNNMKKVFDENKYIEIDSTFFASSMLSTLAGLLDSLQSLVNITNLYQDSLKTAQDSTNALFVQNNLYQDSILQKMGTSVATPITYTVPSQGSSYTWTSENSLTVSGMPMVISGNPQIVSITGVNSVPDSNRLIIQGQGVSIGYSGGVITVTGSTDAVPLPRTSQYAISFCGAEFGLDIPLNAWNAIILNALQGISTSYLSAISGFEDKTEATYSYAIPVGSVNYNYADGYVKLYAGAADSLVPNTYVTWNPDAVTTDLTDWLKVTTLMGFDTVINTTDSIPWTLQDLYDNGYGVPERLMIRIKVIGGVDNAVTDFYRTYSIK